MNENPKHNAFSRRDVLQASLLGAAVATLPRPLFANAQAPLVEIAAGKLQGAESSGIKIFKGVPYGAPPIGAARFQSPRSAPAWAGVKDALAYGNAAAQGSSLLPETPRPGTVSLQGEGAKFSEDCLYLNVWTPALDNGKRPVLVWLHGGGFSTGSGGSRLYDGTNLARSQDVVVLTINHRLNVFGYLDLSQIAGKAYADSSTAGMQDIVLALQWVKQNIARFGGEAGNVTVFGESGGGRKVSVLMGMPAAQGLFHRAVVQSGSALRMDTPEVGLERARNFLDALQLKPTDVDKLLALPTGAILAASAKAMQGSGQFRPTAGAPSLPAHPFYPNAPAMSANVPMMIGTNLTEASFAMGRDPRILALDEAGVVERAKGLVPPDKAADVVAKYKRAYSDLLPSDWLFRISTDRGYFLDSTIQAERKAALNTAPAFLYSFYWQQPLAPGRAHVPHGSEIAFVFNNVELARGENPAPLAAVMSEAWASFARSGNPSTKALGTWTPYDAKNRPTMIFDKQSRMESDPRGELRKLMLSFGSQQDSGREIAPF